MISDNCVFALPMSFHAVQRDVVCCSHSHAHDKAIFSFVKASFNQHVSEGEALQILTLLIILFCSRCAAIHECMSLFSPIMHVDTNRWKSAEDPSSTSQPLSACFARWAFWYRELASLRVLADIACLITVDHQLPGSTDRSIQLRLWHVDFSASRDARE